MTVVKDNEMIDFVIKKLKNDIQKLEFMRWTREEEIKKIKENIKDMQDTDKYNMKEIAVLKHAISVLESKKVNE